LRKENQGMSVKNCGFLFSTEAGTKIFAFGFSVGYPPGEDSVKSQTEK
jgi:hypothetical protein